MQNLQADNTRRKPEAKLCRVCSRALDIAEADHPGWDWYVFDKGILIPICHPCRWLVDDFEHGQRRRVGRNGKATVKAC